MKTGVSLMLIVGLFALGGMTMPAYSADKTLSSKDKHFMKEAAMGGLMEVQLGQTAQNKAQSQDVKDFGMRMATDHGKANDELKQLAQQKKVDLPTQLEHKHKSMVDDITKLSGADFDKKYMQEMVKDHGKDVTEFRYATEKVQDPDVKAWATKTLPVLEQHLQQAKQVAQKLGIDINKAEQEGRKAAKHK